MASTGDFQTPEARLAFADALFEARTLDGTKYQYGCTLIFLNEQRDYFEEIVQKLIHSQWDNKGLTEYKAGRIKSPLLAGDGPQAHNRQNGELWNGFGPDVFFIRANAPGGEKDPKPQLRGKSKHLEATREDIYSGCYGKAIIQGFTWEHPVNGKGVSFGIRGFQKYRDGDPLGGRAPLNTDKWFVDIADDTPDDTPGEQPSVDIFS